MLLSFAISVLLPTARVFGGQIPVVEGVIGGVPSVSSTNELLEFPQVTSNITTPGKLRVVENSGVCETTPGVFQASGYGDLTATESIWFWFFASRKDPENAPLALWFNGGPGSSSMIGLLQENGPCRITNDSTSVTLNPFSWNNEANVLYIDQPVGVGFSHGDTKVGTSEAAAADVWSFLQIFLNDKRFSHLKKNKLALWTESYGGHYGPTFAAHFLKQNSAILERKISGTILNLQVLGIGDGLTNPLAQYPGYLQYAAVNPYHPLVNETVLAAANISWTTPKTGCRDLIIACNAPVWNTTVCSQAQSFCNNRILSPLAGIYDVYYVLTPDPDPYPPQISTYLNNVASKIGGEVQWSQSSRVVYANFANTGDWMRDSSPDLEFVINSGVRTIIYDGDVDYILNFNGVEAMVADLKTIWSPLFKQQKFKSFSVRGQATGLYKNAGKFSYVRIFGAGHEVPAYKYGKLEYGEAAAQMFTQIMRDESLSST
ncbi:Carboxypeptidase S1 [Psilocybe cubensis]|uniref:Carboxypeptidase S1 n=2 Tax=Psilocybe cubensis TaxID=181762 RepID=A0ACB8GWV4_PSICU|nr:Carboxypeptidase S1 [Psilocybe cubensis]KAH9480111.1 Carboxypeptidase S1 [Psilocybe cubensis]